MPLVIGQVTNAWQSIYRIEEYLLSEDQDDKAEPNVEAKYTIDITHIDFTWEQTTTQDPDTVPGAGKKPSKEEVKVKKN